MRKRMAINWALLLSFILSASSGIRLHFLEHGMGHGACHLWRTFHLWASIMLLVMMIIHIKMHWNWYRNWFRKGLGSKSKTTALLSITFLLLALTGIILNPDEKSRFFTYNNGISTTAKSVETVLTQDRGLVITSFTDLQIINGGQTTATLAATNIKNNADLSGIFVQMKLTVLKVEDPDLVRNIATYANSQNKVKTAVVNVKKMPLMIFMLVLMMII